jgi:polyvinyl alcohol dehydrogenase (cytochrome)
MKVWAIRLLPIALLFIVIIYLLNKQPEEKAWQSAGQNLANTREQPNETTINSLNVNKLKVKWSFTTGGDVSATPTVSRNVVYVPDWAGNLFAIDALTGQKIWQHQISEYNHRTGSISRVSPLVLDKEVVIGDNVTTFETVHSGANIMALDSSTGNVKWITEVDKHPAAVITGSPVAFENVIYVGISSNEEGLATIQSYKCCTFRGSIVALDAGTGHVIWQTYTVPPKGASQNQFSGGPIWQPPAIDVNRGLIYVGTGNNYTVPREIEDCESKNLQNHNPVACTPPNDHIDSVMALDAKSGVIKWSQKLLAYDVWNIDCFEPVAGGMPCPSPAGPDFDFSGSGPNLLDNVVGFGQKNGIYWALNPDDGRILWHTQVGPGGVGGGIEWGTASDGKNIYVPIANTEHRPYKLMPNGQTVNWGSWAGLDSSSGKILWQIADPIQGTADRGAASVANGVLYIGSESGTMYGLDAKTGNIRWSFASGGSVFGGPSIVDGVVYWGSGYSRLGTGNNKLYAFDLPK